MAVYEHTHARRVQVVKIAMVGKYTDLSDAYLSVIKALQHACLAASRKLKIEWVEAGNLEETCKAEEQQAYEGEVSRCAVGGQPSSCRAMPCSRWAPPTRPPPRPPPCRRLGTPAQR